MQTATVMAKAHMALEPNLWQEFKRALAHRHFIRALEWMNELLQDKELETRTTFSWHTGKPVYMSVATQIRCFCTAQLARVRRRKIRWKIKGEWRQWVAKRRS